MSGNGNSLPLTEGLFPKEYNQGFPELIETPSWKPWHKPRKFWLRQNQWNKEIEKLVEKLRLQDRPLVYFGLPGDDLIDFRFIVDLCEQKKLPVKLVGFNDCQYSNSSRQDLEIARNEVFSSDFVRENSDIHHDMFQKISDSNSVAFKFANEKGPYDVINLDLCGSFSGIEQEESYYEAAYNLFQFQVENRTEPWIFLLTTRADKKKVNWHDMPNFWQNIITNMAHSNEFKDIIENSYLKQTIDENTFLPKDLVKLESPLFENLFGVLLSKWLLKIMHSAGAWSVTLLASYCYRTNTAGLGYPNMLSLAYYLERQPVKLTDPSQLVKIASSKVNTSTNFEVIQAIEILAEMNRIIDIDDYLYKHPDEFDEYIEISARYLEVAGYRTDSYKSWAKSMIPVILTKGSST